MFAGLDNPTLYRTFTAGGGLEVRQFFENGKNLLRFYQFRSYAVALIVSCCTSDAPSADLDQLELPVLCDGLRRYLQDLPLPIIPPAVYPQMVHTAKGEHTKCLRAIENSRKPQDVINVSSPSADTPTVFLLLFVLFFRCKFYLNSLGTRCSVTLHSSAATGPETGYLWLIGAKRSLKVYLSHLEPANHLRVYLKLIVNRTLLVRFCRVN